MYLTEINCKELFKNAYERRYTWDSKFSGYKGKCIFSVNSDTYKGSFVLGKDFKPEIHNIDDQKIVKSISSQLFEVSIHRVKREFKEIHSKNNFNLIKDSESGIEMMVSGKSEGDKYRVKNNCINMVYRKIHGIIIEIFVQEFFDTGNGFLSKKYTSQQIDPNTLKANSLKLEYEDRFINIGSQDIWILNSRSIKYLNKNQEEDIQEFIFEDLSLLG
ncbi:conserved hypothetical protein [Prochlorococcus marinus subsp. pastoris str. CCMP1986]|jgi:hypothetical protein|uniref:DUF3386 domain-containing protein n=1 Tax=Prochlorococcus marinus subsp. pastoris (strain CCMP1986 / NIES-2087 / MED4) TaxID=59919 RepID=Q7V0T3_PROMP|nr:DUF3386 domain-containing protein [Prochlorococcus marinus]KGF87270.1 hypothetical protein PROCH_0858 [Prochlorococcus marinus str. EQPAC1]CAE19629.1 conserved hypothetical protein [Prochlorococcus marinus subsp. pastoris str. CCMP1986]|tara:strand:- start:1855 stop:2505 length:651 start_codon:yes stop_codon:yes gene_type:complete